MEKIIALIITATLATLCCVLSVLQFKEKGFLFNNAYIYASKREREKMNKKVFYRQSGIVFAIFTIYFFCLALNVLTDIKWFMYLGWVLIIFVIIYAIVSTMKIYKKNGSKWI